jgi:hypothetical protein
MASVRQYKHRLSIAIGNGGHGMWTSNKRISKKMTDEHMRLLTKAIDATEELYASIEPNKSYKTHDA